MLKSYLLVALRNMKKQKFFTVINILGMSIGITASLLISLYILDEFSYDRFHADAKKIYQVGLHGKIGGQDIMTANTCPPMAQALVTDFSEVEAATRVSPYGSIVLKIEDKAIKIEKTFYADSNFFEFFSFKLWEGDLHSALKEPNSLVITKNTAIKLFGNTPALGKVISVGSANDSYKVTGIAADAPSNSHLKFNVLISSASQKNLRSTVWLNNYLFTYFKLRNNTSIETFNKKYDYLVEKYVGSEVEKFMGITLKQLKEQGGAFGYYSTPLLNIHLHSTSKNDIEEGGNIMYIYFFAGIGIFIIVIACINFMNLSTARSANRAKEVGLRKTLGSLRSQLINQFLCESLAYTIASVSLAIIMCYFLLPTFNLLSGKELLFQTFNSPIILVGLIGLILFVGFVAGSYPAFYLTSFSPVAVLKGKVKSGLKSKGVRSTLVVMQFGLSIFLIIFTAVVFQQTKFLREKNLGFDKSKVIVLEGMSRLNNNKMPFRDALVQQSNISNASFTDNRFPGINNTTVFKSVESDQDHVLGVYTADYDHQKVMHFELKEGRYFSKDFPSDTTAILLNEAAVKEFGWKEPVNQELLYNGNGRNQRFKIIGIIKDFTFESFKTGVRPLSIMLTKNDDVLMIRYQGSSSEALQTIEKIWKNQAGNEPLEYSFLDDNFNKLFKAEQQMGKLFSVFSGLAIFIACLGLFALAAFSAEQRTKEIGIRKAMGASSLSVMRLLSVEFTKLVLIGFIPAAAIGWYISNNWLTSFAYRIEVSPVLIILSGVLSIGIAWITVSYQAIKAARSNPVDSLRYE